MMWFRRKRKERPSGEHAVSGLPKGTEVIHNPASGELETEVGFPEESDLLERHGRRFHLIEGRDRIAIECAHFVDRRVHGRPQLVQDQTVYVLPQGTSLMEARRIGYHPLDLGSEREAEMMNHAALDQRTI
jgi:hypothetical protein